MAHQGGDERKRPGTKGRAKEEMKGFKTHVPEPGPACASIPTLALPVVQDSENVGRRIGDIQLRWVYGAEIVKMMSSKKKDWIDQPLADEKLGVGDVLYVMLDPCCDHDNEVCHNATVPGKDANEGFMRCFKKFVKPVADSGDSNCVELVAERSGKFSKFVEDFMLEKAALRIVFFFAFELPYLGPEPAIIGPAAKYWTDTSDRPFPKLPRGCLALHTTENFGLCPKLVCRKDRATYIMPVKQETVIYTGDLLLLLLPGGPKGSGNKQLQLGPHFWTDVWTAWNTALEDFGNKDTFNKTNWKERGIKRARPRWADEEDDTPESLSSPGTS